MERKLKAMEQSGGQLAETVRSSAQQIWQAGLGAFARAQEEGADMFAQLVKEGADFQERKLQEAEQRMSGMTETVTKMADSFSRQAAGYWEKMESMLEDRVARSLRGLGVPTQQDIRALTEKVAALDKSVHALSAKPKAAAKKPAPKAQPKKSAAASARRTASKKTSRSVATHA